MSYCLICYKSCDNPAPILNEAKAKVKSEIKIFSNILERYINGGKDEGSPSPKFPNGVDKVVEGGIVSCQKCHILMEEFCDIYYILEETEMILNWKVKCLAGIMECAGDLVTGVEEAAKEVMEWRRMIVAKCNGKIQSSFPKLILRRGLSLANNKTLMEGIGAETPLNLEDIRDDRNRPIETPAEMAPQTTLDKNEDAQTGSLIINRIADVSLKTNTSLVSSETEGADYVQSICNEHAYNFHEDDFDYKPVDFSNDESSSSDSDNLENTLEESNALTTSKSITEEKSQTSFGDMTKETVKHVTVNLKVETSIQEEDSNLENPTTNDQAVQRQASQHRNFDCAVCSKIFKDVLSLRHHYYKIHKRKFVCRFCGIKMSTGWRLKQHNLLHTGKKPFHCDLCDRRFSWKQSLQAHLVAHGKKSARAETSRSFKCKICNVRYKLRWKLIAHLRRSHPGQRPMKEHSDKDNQAEGTEITTNVLGRLRRILSCPKCSKTLSTSQKLQAHLTSHSSDEDKIPPTNQINDDAFFEEDCDEFNPGELSLDESDSSSSDSEIESDFENINEGALSSATDEIFIKKEAILPTKTQLDKTSHDKLLKRFEAYSHMVEFITFPCQIEGCTKILYSSSDFEDHKLQHGTFSCSLCPTSFNYASDLALHELSKHCKHNAKCPREGCKFKGTTNKQYIRHALISHLNLKLALNGRKFNCKFCKNGFRAMGQLRRHFPSCRIAAASTNTDMAKIDKLLHKLQKKYKADSDIVDFLTFPCQTDGCSEILFSSNDFEDHKGHHGTFSCSLCPTTFDYAPNLARHELSEHYKDKKNCFREGCDFKVNESRRYIHHVLSQHLKLKYILSGRKFNCKICKNGFRTISDLKNHFRSCQIAKASTNKVKCEVEGCTKTFRNAIRMGEHKRRFHFTGAKPICKICKKTFASNKGLNRHQRKLHRKDMQIKCFVEGCEEMFMSEINLDNHVFHRHENEKDKISKLCPHCGKKFAGSHQLQRHLKSHERPKTKRYICEICGKVFKQNEQLRVHKLSHVGPASWEYQCEVCAKKCITKQKLEEHKRTHGNEKPFVCDICGAKYAHRHNLRIHVNTKHGHLTKDVAKPYTKVNFTSRKGVKRKKMVLDEEESSFSSSDSDSSN